MYTHIIFKKMLVPLESADHNVRGHWKIKHNHCHLCAVAYNPNKENMYFSILEVMHHEMYTMLTEKWFNQKSTEKSAIANLLELENGEHDAASCSTVTRAPETIAYEESFFAEGAASTAHDSDGAVEQPPPKVLAVASTNRRSLIPGLRVLKPPTSSSSRKERQQSVVAAYSGEAASSEPPAIVDVD